MAGEKRLQTVAATSVFVTDVDGALTVGERDAVIADETEAMKKDRFQKLTDSLAEVARHVGSGRFRGRISKVEIGADDVRAVRRRSGLTQRQFAAAFGIGLGTLQKWERGERSPSGATKSLLKVMQADLAAVIKALVPPPRKGRRAA